MTAQEMTYWHEGRIHRFVAIEYRQEGVLWVPFNVLTSPEGSKATYSWDCEWSKAHETLLFHNAGGGFGSYYVCDKFIEPSPPPAALWVADGIQLVAHKIRGEGKRKLTVAQALNNGYVIIPEPLPLKDGPNPFEQNNSEEAEAVWCKECQDWYYRDHDDPCEHLEWCDQCGQHVYYPSHVPSDDPDGEPVVHKKADNEHDD
jgi:hypothetical protein